MAAGFERHPIHFLFHFSSQQMTLLQRGYHNRHFLILNILSMAPDVLNASPVDPKLEPGLESKVPMEDTSGGSEGDPLIIGTGCGETDCRLETSIGNGGEEATEGKVSGKSFPIPARKEGVSKVGFLLNLCEQTHLKLHVYGNK